MLEVNYHRVSDNEHTYTILNNGKISNSEVATTVWQKKNKVKISKLWNTANVLVANEQNKYIVEKITQYYYEQIRKENKQTQTIC